MFQSLFRCVLYRHVCIGVCVGLLITSRFVFQLINSKFDLRRYILGSHLQTTKRCCVHVVFYCVGLFQKRKPSQKTSIVSEPPRLFDQRSNSRVMSSSHSTTSPPRASHDKLNGRLDCQSPWSNPPRKQCHAPPTVVILNGPRHCGKQTAALCAAHLSCDTDENNEFVTRDLNTPLVEMTRNFYGISVRDWCVRSTPELRNAPWTRLNGLSQEQALVRTCTSVLKPTLGNDVFGHAVACNLEAGKCHIICHHGTESEIYPIITAVCPHRVLVIQIAREGCAFEPDSGHSYLPRGMAGVRDFVSIDNDGTIDDLVKVIEHLVKTWRGGNQNHALSDNIGDVGFKSCKSLAVSQQTQSQSSSAVSVSVES
jgi:hypothetical protein